MKYRAEIDGMRTFAVVPVILFHLGIPALIGGFLGVDVFFVLSGFLISRIVFDELERGTFTFTGFWMRRVRRIVPALLAMVAFVLLALYPLVFSPGWHQVAQHALAAVASLANVAFLRDLGDYWGASAESSPLLHTWSLSVEEQFYFFFPALALVLRRRSLRSTVFVILALISLVAALYAQVHRPVFGFYMLPTRAWELGAGVLASLHAENYRTHVPARIQSILSAAGLAAVVTACFCAHSPGAWSIAAVAGSALVLLDRAPGSWTARFLSWQPFVLVGRLSYSAYLWHWPLIVLAAAYSIRLGSTPSLPVLAGLITAFAAASYLWVETPARRTHHLWRIVIPELVLVGLLAGAYLFLPPREYDVSGFEPVAFSGYKYSVTASPLPSSLEGERMRRGTRQPAPLPSGRSDLLAEGLSTGARTTGQPDVVVLGDSHGCMWAELLDSTAARLGLKVAMFTSIGIPPLFPLPLSVPDAGGPGFTPDQLRDFRASMLERIASWRPRAVVIAARWDNLQPQELSWFTPLAHRLSTGGTRLLVLEQPPRIDIGNSNSAQFLSFAKVQPELGATGWMRIPAGATTLESNASIRRQCAELSGCEMLPVYDSFASGSRARATKGRTVYYYDDDHLSTQGTFLFSIPLRLALARATSRDPR